MKKALLLAAVLAAGCAAHRGAPLALGHEGPLRVAVLPPHNVSGAVIDSQGVYAGVEAALARAGIAVVDRARVDAFLTRNRVRFTGGVDAELAEEGRDALEVDGFVITAVERTVELPVPQFAVSLRLVAATRGAEVLWSDGAAMAADESPRLLGLGQVGDLDALQRRAIDRSVRSLAAFLAGRREPADPCDPGRFGPRVSFRSAHLDAKDAFTVAVLPFVNDTDRRDAGDVVAGTISRQLLATGRFRVLEPGVVRRVLLGQRVVQEGGVTLEEARVLTQTLGVDLVVAGRVYAFYENPTADDAPHVEFTVTAIHRGDKQTYWQSSSHARGDDGLNLFGFGKTGSAGRLTCQMARGVAHGMARR